jgi:hypothetical protein
MVISTDPHFLFIHIPKTAGTSVEEALYCYQDFKYRTSPHAIAKQYKDYFPPEDYEKFFKFAFVRNPYDLVFSTWKFFVKNHEIRMEFKEWVKWRYNREPIMSKLNCYDDNSHIPESNRVNQLGTSYYVNRPPQVMFFMDDNGDLLIDYIGRFENVENDFYEIVSHLNLEDVYLPHTNKSGNEFMVNDYRHFYDEETKEIVRKNHLFDLEFFGYEFDNPNPKKNFGFNKYKNISDAGFDFPNYNYFNLGNLVYGQYDVVERNKMPDEDLQRHYKNFETEKVRTKMVSYKSKLEKIRVEISKLESVLFELDIDKDVSDLQREILKLRESELVFATKYHKSKKLYDSMGPIL